MKNRCLKRLVVYFIMLFITIPVFAKNLAPSNGEIFKIIRLNINKTIAYINITTEVLIDVPPLIQNNRTFVPLRFIAEAFNAQVDWNPDKRQVTIRSGDTEINLWIGKKMTTISTDRDMYNFELDAEPFIRSGRTLIPIRFVAETFKCQVDWFKDQQMVVIYFVPSVKGYTLEQEVKIKDQLMSMDVDQFVLTDADHIVYIGTKYNDDLEYGIIEKITRQGKSVWRIEYKYGWFNIFEKIQDGSFVALGGIKDTMYLFKFSSNGKELWRKSLGSDEDDYEDMVYIPNKGFILVGDRNTRYAKGEKMQNYCQGFIVGLDMLGNKIWSKTYDEPGVVNGFFCINKFVGSNKCIIAGCFGKSQPGYMIIDDNGNKLFQRSLPNSIGYFNSICNTFDNMFLLSGNLRFSMADTRANSFFVKVDQKGKDYLTNRVTDISDNKSDSIRPLANGDYIVSGHAHANNGDGQNLLVTYDKNGKKKDQFVWGDGVDMYIHQTLPLDDGSFMSMGCGKDKNGIRSIFIYQYFPLFFEL